LHPTDDDLHLERPSKTRVRLSVAEIVTILVVLLIAAAIFYPVYVRPESRGARIRSVTHAIEAYQWDDARELIASASPHMQSNMGMVYLAAYIDYKQDRPREARDKLAKVLLSQSERTRGALAQMIVLHGELCLLLDEPEAIPHVYPASFWWVVEPETPREYLAGGYLRLGGDGATAFAARLAPDYYERVRRAARYKPVDPEAEVGEFLLLDQPWDLSRALHLNRPVSQNPVVE